MDVKWSVLNLWKKRPGWFEKRFIWLLLGTNASAVRSSLSAFNHVQWHTLVTRHLLWLTNGAELDWIEEKGNSKTVMRFGAHGAFTAGVIKQHTHLVISVVKIVLIIQLQNGKQGRLLGRYSQFGLRSTVKGGKWWTLYSSWLEERWRSRAQLLNKTASAHK